jgi:plasmid stability protein
MVAFNVRNVPGSVASALRERASRHGHSLQQELLLILEAAAAEPVTDLPPPPPISLHTVRSGTTSTWSREAIYEEDGR